MSRGPGKIERTILTLFAEKPDDAYSTEDLCDVVFAGVNRVEKKHRVSVIRAAKSACERAGGWTQWSGEGLGGSLVFWNRYNVMSYAMARLKVDGINLYRTNDARVMSSHWRSDAKRLREYLQPGGKHHAYVVEGGHWWRHVQMNIAERDGDTVKLEAFREVERPMRRAVGMKE